MIVAVAISLGAPSSNMLHLKYANAQFASSRPVRHVVCCYHRSRRTKSIPQLICVPEGTAGCPNRLGYLFDTATCTNQGVSNAEPREATMN